MRLRRMVKIVAGVAAASLLGGLTMTGTALADDGRSVSPIGELRAVYQHAQQRVVSDAFFDGIQGDINDNCETAVVTQTYSAMTSYDTTALWTTPMDQAGALYAALLNRAPDESGLLSYTDSIAAKGLPWATGEMMGSQEYRDRLRTICSVSTGQLDASMYDWQGAVDYANDELVSQAKGHISNCKLGELLRGTTNALLVDLEAGGEFVSQVTEITNEIHAKLESDRTCKAGAAKLEAAAYVTEVINAGNGYNPVYIRYEEHQDWDLGWDFVVTVGADPFSVRKFEGTYSSGFVGKLGDF